MKKKAGNKNPYAIVVALRKWIRICGVCWKRFLLRLTVHPISVSLVSPAGIW